MATILDLHSDHLSVIDQYLDDYDRAHVSRACKKFKDGYWRHTPSIKTLIIMKYVDNLGVAWGKFDYEFCFALYHYATRVQDETMYKWLRWTRCPWNGVPYTKKVAKKEIPSLPPTYRYDNGMKIEEVQCIKRIDCAYLHWTPYSSK